MNPNLFTEEQTQEAARKTVSKARAASAYIGKALTVEVPGDHVTNVVERTQRNAAEGVLDVFSGGHRIMRIPLGVADILLEKGVYHFSDGTTYVLKRKALKDEQLALLDKAAAFLLRNMEETCFHLKNAEKRETISQALVAQDARKMKSLLRYHVQALERLMDSIQKEIIDKE